jgi:polyisoprenoid-binding protein YceI
MRADRDTAIMIAGHFATDPGRPEATRAAHLAGTLTVTGVTQNVALEAETERLPDGALRVSSHLPLTLSGFRITPPRVLFGAIRARDAISVEVNLVF